MDQILKNEDGVLVQRKIQDNPVNITFLLEDRASCLEAIVQKQERIDEIDRVIGIARDIAPELVAAEETKIETPR